ncbi:MAG: hypothetical protein Q9159_005403 [Coniocarpon cinnabarinum]
MAENKSFGSTSDDRNGLLSSFSTEIDTPNTLSPGSTLIGSVASPQHPRQRSGYSRLTPSPSPDFPRHDRFEETNEGDIGTRGPGQGLGITGEQGDSDTEEYETHDRFEAGASERSLPYSFSSTAPLRSGSQAYHKAKTSDFEGRKSTTSLRSRKSYAEFSPHMTCASREPILKDTRNHIYITLLILGIFSTIFSGIYLGIAIARPRYQKFISDEGNLTYSNATLLFALFAKLIELSFVTVFIAFVGQVISTRAFNKSKGYGVTLAEISMRGWIMQPGQMIVHPHAVKYAAVSLMGVLALIAALTAMLYTTAASALVSPQLSWSHFTDRLMQADIKQGFADMTSIMYQCQTPVRNDASGVLTKFQTCIGPEQSAQSLNDFSTWLGNWTRWVNASGGSDDLRRRPPPYSLVSDNTTAVGQWIEIDNMTVNSNNFNRIVNNVTMAMPHAGIIDAAINKNNSILQPKVNDGFGAYNIHASVASGALNVLCAEMTKEELRPFVYTEWPNANKSLDFANWVNNYAPHSEYVPNYGPNEWLNSSIVDQIFGFGPVFGQRRPPIFPRYPTVYNTLLNNTGAYAPLPYRDALYILGGNPDAEGNISTYSLCQMRAFRTPSCSTWYNATSSQSHMVAQCEQANDPMQFQKTEPNAARGNDTTSLLWVDVADSWATAVTLNTGITDGNAANARLVTQFFPTERSFDPQMPSMAEALAVMAGGTLMMGTRNAPVRAMQDYAPDAKLPTETFSARLQSQQYASGPISGYQNLFYVILIAVFAGNVLVLTWLIMNRGLVTDFCDPANMFSLSINSPPSHVFAGSCGCGPEGRQYRAKWFVNVDGEHVFIENSEREQELAENQAKGKASTTMGAAASPIIQAYAKLSKRKSIF